MSATASYFSADELRSRFASGGLFLEAERYKLDAGRRTAPGEVEVHERDVDVMYAVEGTATVVTGDETHRLGPGDVLEIPAGVPHQFIEVSDPFLYFVVKVET